MRWWRAICAGLYLVIWSALFVWSMGPFGGVFVVLTAFMGGVLALDLVNGGSQ